MTAAEKLRALAMESEGLRLVPGVTPEAVEEIATLLEYGIKFANNLAGGASFDTDDDAERAARKYADCYAKLVDMLPEANR